MILAVTLSGCTVVGGLIGATSQSVHNRRAALRPGQEPPFHRTVIGLVIGLAIDATLVGGLLAVDSQSYGK